MIPFEAANFKEHQNYVIEASAGTGKTHNIIEIIKNLNKKNVPLKKLLIVTYTEKAAGELKDRIRRELPHEDVSHASIYTIHSFCQAAIKELGLSANLPLDLKIINDAYLDDFTDRYIRQGDILDDISKVVSRYSNYNEDNLKALLIDALSKYYLNNQFCEDKDIVSLDTSIDYRGILDFDYDIVTSESLSELALKYSELGEHYQNLINSNIQKDIDFAHNLEETYKDNFNFNGRKFQKKWFSDPDSQASFDYFFKLKEFYKSYNPNIYLVGTYLKNYYTSWQLEKRRYKEQTLDDLIRNVREELLKDNSLMLKELKNKYQYGIIDEFQDTNRKQYDIFSKIFLNDDQHNLIVVGDPKQSIYSFQGADVNVYSMAVKEISSQGQACMLNKNFRSTGAMVEACNHIFERYKFAHTHFEETKHLEFTKDHMEHAALYRGQAAKAFWIGCRSKEKEDHYSPINEREFAALVVKKILDFCSQDRNGHTHFQIKDKSASEFRDISFKDFAVLARTRSEMTEMQKALKKAGIPFIQYKDQGLFKGKECADWIALCEALDSVDFTGRNRRYFRKALFTNFFGLSLKDIADDRFNYDDTPEMCLINNWKLLAAEGRWEDLFDAIMADSGISTRMTSLKDIQSLAIYKQIAQYCIEYLSNGHSLEHLVTKLTNLTTHEDEDDEQNGTIVEKNTDFDCVQMMTMHASKGLQFPIVICVGGFKAFDNKKSIAIYHNKLNQAILTLKKKDHKEVEDEQIEECQRLYYVGYTRAQCALMLPYYEKVTCKFLNDAIESYMLSYKGEYEALDTAKDSYVTYEELRQTSQAILNRDTSCHNMDDTTKEEQDAILKELIAKEFTKRCYKHSYSSLSHGGDDTMTDPTLNDKEGVVMGGLSQFDTHAKPILGHYDTHYNGLTLPLNYPKGTSLGTALHSVLEQLAFDHFEERLISYIERAFREQNLELKEEWTAATLAMMINILGSELPLIAGSHATDSYLVLKDIDYTSIKTEAEFNANLLQGHLKNYCNGFIDVIFKFGDCYAIIDWKSDKLNEDFIAYNDAVSLKARVDNCYSIQRTLYSYILIKILKNYYPDLTEEEIFNKHFGGIYYIFMRGCQAGTSNGVYAQTWESYDALEDAFNDILKQKI